MKAYGFTASDTIEMESAFTDRIPPATGRWRVYFGEDGADFDIPTFAHIALSWAFGCAFGRWNIQHATGRKAAPELPEPFAPLPVCPPGQLQNAQGLPIEKAEVEKLKTEGKWNYPIEIPWDGILVDDPNHPLDIERRVRQVIEIIWGTRNASTPHPTPGRGGKGEPPARSKLFRLPKWQKALKECWQKLTAGDYDWAHLSYSIWPDRVRKLCEGDRTIAIAHGLEHLCKLQEAKRERLSASSLASPSV